MAENRDIILLTGFGPFMHHTVNPSWEAVKQIPRPELDDRLNATVVVQELPVNYKFVADIIPELWGALKPALVIHVGVSSTAKAITLERLARNYGYVKPDVENEMPDGEKCVLGGSPSLVSLLDLDTIADRVTATTGVFATTSIDAGLFLCEFAFYLSLRQNAARVVFVHVPPAGTIYTLPQLISAIESVIVESLIQSRIQSGFQSFGFNNH